MTRFKRPAASFGAAALLALSLTACGGSDGADAPDDASKEDFCDAVNALNEGGSSDKPTEEEFDEYQDKVDELAEVGTPESIDDDARKGFELFVETIQDFDYGDVEDAGDNFLEDEFSSEEQDQFVAFFTYAGTECTEIPDVEDIPTE